MHFTSFIPALLSLSPLAIASPLFEKRGTVDMTCGNVGAGANQGLTCASTPGSACCSANGWCGDTADFCGAGCQPQFGSCDASGGTTTTGAPATTATAATTATTPTPTTGGSTANVPRTQVGSVPYGGSGIIDCTVPGVVALTFDDGPYLYTDGFLDYLAGQGVVATFFVTGNNLDKGAIDDPSTPWSAVIKKMDAAGHQIASHTWTHPDLSTLTEDARRTEMYRNEQAFVSILGKFPTYMRPPYSSCTGGCPQTMSDLGYHVCYFDLDTDDYNHLNDIQVAKTNVDNAMAGKSPNNGDGFLSIAHDIHQVTAQDLAPYMVTKFKAAGYKFVTIGDCLGDPRANWYRSP